MKRWIAVGAAVTTMLIGLACAGGGSYQNKAACKAWLDKQNGLKCMESAQLDASVCPDQLDQSPIDMKGYYECMEKNAKCKGKIPDLGGQASCKMPTH